jgi:tetratricopeptide (TPR) repeat protein
MVAFDWEAAAAAADASLRQGRRTPEALIILAHALLNSRVLREREEAQSVAATDVPSAMSLRDDDPGLYRRVIALASDAVSLLETRELPQRLATALLVRGAAQVILGSRSDARADFERARGLDPDAWEPVAKYAQLVLEDDGPAAALSVLESRASALPHPAILSVKGQALVALGEFDRAERMLRQAVGASIGESEETEVRLVAAELLIEAGRLGTADTLVQRLPNRSREWVSFVLRGRIAAMQSNRSAADNFYNEAIHEAPNERYRREVRLEYARALGARGDYEPALAQFEAADAARGRDDARRLFLRTLYSAGKYARLAEHLEALSREGPLPYWADELAAFLAHAREDLPNEVAHLERYIQARPSDVDRIIQLLHAYVRQHRIDDAKPLLARVGAIAALSGIQLIRIAHLSSHAGEHREAIELGVRGVRRAPGELDVQLGFVALILTMRGDARIPPAEAVGPDTHVLLESAEGDAVEYLILQEGPVDPSHDEALPTDDRVEDLIGHRAGDVIRRRVGALSEAEYTVKEIKPAAVHLFQRILANHHKQFPSSIAFQMLKISDEPTVRDFAGVIRTVEQDADRHDIAFRLHDERLLPLGSLAAALGSDVSTMYNTLTQPGRRLMTEYGAAEAREASVGSARDFVLAQRPVVIAHSALLTMQQLQLLDLVGQIGREVLVPQALLDDLELERAKWEEASVEGHRVLGRDDQGGLRFYEFSAEAVQPLLTGIEQRLAWVGQHCTIVPLPPAAAEPGEERSRELLGGESFAALSIARDRNAMLYADDLGLRGLAKTEENVPSFSTWALLQAVSTEGALSAEARDEHVFALIKRRHNFISVSAEFLHNLLRASAYQLHGDVLLGIAQLAGPETDIMSSVLVATGLLRILATSALGGGAISSVTAACADAISTNRRVGPSLLVFDRSIQEHLALAPFVLKEARDAIQRVLRAKQGSV